MKNEITPSMSRPFEKAIPESTTTITATAIVPTIEVVSSRSNGWIPSTTRPASSVATITASSDSRPCSDQYTSSSRSQSANSSSVSPTPIPKPIAVICHQGA